MKVSQLVFTGLPQEFSSEELERRPKGSPSEPEPYVASTGLIQAVNLAMHVGRPLLLEGEAGSGKTRLARAIAYELGLPLHTWHVRSTIKAIEGLYTYDALLRLHDVQVRQLAVKTDDQATGSTLRDPGTPKDYRDLGPLGRHLLKQSTRRWCL